MAVSLSRAQCVEVTKNNVSRVSRSLVICFECMTCRPFQSIICIWLEQPQLSSILFHCRIYVFSGACGWNGYFKVNTIYRVIGSPVIEGILPKGHYPPCLMIGLFWQDTLVVIYISKEHLHWKQKIVNLKTLLSLVALSVVFHTAVLLIKAHIISGPSI